MPLPFRRSTVLTATVDVFDINLFLVALRPQRLKHELGMLSNLDAQS